MNTKQITDIIAWVLIILGVIFLVWRIVSNLLS